MLKTRARAAADAEVSKLRQENERLKELVSC